MTDMPDMQNGLPREDRRVQSLVDGLIQGKIERRDFLRRVVGLGFKSSVAYALLHDSSLQAQNYTTLRVGEEGTARRPVRVRLVKRAI